MLMLSFFFKVKVCFPDVYVILFFLGVRLVSPYVIKTQSTKMSTKWYLYVLDKSGPDSLTFDPCVEVVSPLQEEKG